MFINLLRLYDIKACQLDKYNHLGASAAVVTLSISISAKQLFLIMAISSFSYFTFVEWLILIRLLTLLMPMISSTLNYSPLWRVTSMDLSKVRLY